jgi:hypothetical protein
MNFTASSSAAASHIKGWIKGSREAKAEKTTSMTESAEKQDFSIKSIPQISAPNVSNKVISLSSADADKEARENLKLKIVLVAFGLTRENSSSIKFKAILC